MNTQEIIKFIQTHQQENVKFAVSKPEIRLLQDLLKIETIYQIRCEFQNVNPKDEADVFDRVSYVSSIFDNYRWASDNLSIVQSSMDFLDNQEIRTKYPDQIEKLQDYAVFSKSLLMVFKVICEDSIKLGLPHDIKVNYDQHAPNLLTRLNEALGLEHENKAPSDVPAYNVFGGKVLA